MKFTVPAVPNCLKIVLYKRDVRFAQDYVHVCGVTCTFAALCVVGPTNDNSQIP